MTLENTLPAAMAAVLLTGHGGLDKLAYRTDVPVPRPAPGKVVVKVIACGMNNTDVWVGRDAYGTEESAMAKDFVGKLVVVPDAVAA